MQVTVQRIPQVAHHPLPYQVGQIGLYDTQPAGHDGNAAHYRAQNPEQAHIGAAPFREEGVVKNHLYKYRVNHTQSGGDQNQQADQNYPARVGTKGSYDSRDKRLRGCA